MPEFSIVIPCRDEAARLPATLLGLREELQQRGVAWEILIVVEPGTDETPALARAEAQRDPRVRALINSEPRGKGWAVRTGMLAAEGDLVFFTDADLSVPARFVAPFAEALRREADVAIASRRHPQTRIPHPQPWTRVAAGRLFNFALRVAGATRRLDTQCGFKGFRRAAARAVFERVQAAGFGFDVEALAWAEALGLNILELPVEWNDAPGSKVRPLRDGIAAFLEGVRGARRAHKNRT